MEYALPPHLLPHCLYKTVAAQDAPKCACAATKTPVSRLLLHCNHPSRDETLTQVPGQSKPPPDRSAAARGSSEPRKSFRFLAKDSI